MAPAGLVDDMPASQKYPYATSEQPNDLTDEDLQFLSIYTGQKDLGALREHVIRIWRSVKDTVQRFMFPSAGQALRQRARLNNHGPFLSFCSSGCTDAFRI